jgi:hypothetical protein
LLVVALGLAISLFGLGHLWLSLREVLDAAEQAPLWRLMGVLLLVLIPTAGIYSLVTQFAFWEGWIGGLPEPSRLFATSPPNGACAPRRYVVYLDGIHQRANDHPPRITTFLRRLARALGPDTLLVEAIEAYTVLPVGLAEEPGSAWFWRRLLQLQEQHPNGVVQVLAGMLVQANNVIKVAISSDRRYGPILNVELALKVADQLAAAGFHPSSGATITLLGYSGGGEMAMGMADDLRRAGSDGAGGAPGLPWSLPPSAHQSLESGCQARPGAPRSHPRHDPQRQRRAVLRAPSRGRHRGDPGGVGGWGQERCFRSSRFWATLTPLAAPLRCGGARRGAGKWPARN